MDRGAPRTSWSGLAALFRTRVERSLAEWVPPTSPNYPATLAFALGRFDEGRGIVGFLADRLPAGPLRVLDIGAGNGGVGLALANDPRLRVSTLDILPNRELVGLKRETGFPLAAVVGVGEHLPFADGAFDAVTCLETIEHVPDAAALGREIMRVLRPGGLCMVTTPPRLRFLFRPDPHFGLRGLLFLPDRLQRIWAEKVRGVPNYDVVHIFASASGIVRLFPGALDAEVFPERPGEPGAGRRIRLRNWLWERIVIRKR